MDSNNQSKSTPSNKKSSWLAWVPKDPSPRNVLCSFKFWLIVAVSFSISINILLYATSIDLFEFDYDDIGEQLDLLVEQVLPQTIYNKTESHHFLHYGHLRML